MRSHPGIVIIALATAFCGSTTDVTSPTQAVTPPQSAGHALVYHDGLEAVLLVNAGLGGMSTPASATRTKLYQWNGSNWTVVDSAGPPIRNLGGVAYDAKRNALVMYGGGYDQNLVYDDTWEWTPQSGWIQKTATGPGKRDHTQMVYDAARERVVLFGGQHSVTSFPRETWTWDGSTWTNVSSSGPQGRVHHAMVYDREGSRVLLFGGRIPGAGTSGETWEWKGSTWNLIGTTTPRSHAAAGATSQGVILFGGMPAGQVMRLNGATWSADPQSNAPPPRYLAAMAFDRKRNVTVLFGGGDLANDQLSAETWEYSDNSGWRRAQ